MSNISGSDIPNKWPHHWGIVATIGFLLLVAAVVGSALYFVDQAGRRTIAAAQAETVAVEITLLKNTYDGEGGEELLKAIMYRLTSRNASNERIYALADSRGRLVAGNLRRWPDGLIPGISWQRVGGTNSPALYLSSVRLDDGNLLIVGNTDAAMERFRNQIVDAGFMSLLIVLTACGIAALIISLYFRVKVMALANVATKVTHGDFSARAPGANHETPFGQIAAAQNLMLERIEHLVVGLTTITDSLAHDLRTPLSRLKRSLEKGIEAETAEDREEALEAALQESDHIIATFSALIDIARANGGLSRSAMDTLDLQALLQEVQTLFEPLIEERGGRLELDAPLPVKVSGHKALLMQAISNLVDNAIKHAPDSSTVQIILTHSSREAEITVADHGPGIPVSDRDQLLKRFSRGGNAPPGGVGLGLAIAKACAVLHRGSIWLEDNNPGLKVKLVLSRY